MDGLWSMGPNHIEYNDRRRRRKKKRPEQLGPSGFTIKTGKRERGIKYLATDAY